MIENFTVQKVPKCVVLASGAVRVQMDLSYGGNTLQVSTYDLGLGEMMIKCFLVGTVQTVKGKGKKRGGRAAKREGGVDVRGRDHELFILAKSKWPAA